MRRLVLLGLLALTAAAAGGSHKVVRKTAILDFSYEWPAEAVAIATLDGRFYTDAKKALARAQKNAQEEHAFARKQKFNFNPHEYSMEWTTAGQTPRLLSLQSEFSSYEGGAHPNTSYNSLLWDRRADKEITVGSLFLHAQSFSALTRPAYCKALDAERRKRREGEKLDLPEFNACPKYSDLAIAFLDKNRNGRFDTIHFVASPYVAGPYVEGEYEVALPVTRQLIAAIKPDYRGSFEPQRQ
jgi:hypothetical protein